MQSGFRKAAHPGKGRTMAGETEPRSAWSLPPTREAGLLGGVCGSAQVGLGDITAPLSSSLVFDCLGGNSPQAQGSVLCAKRAFPDGALKHSSAWCTVPGLEPWGLLRGRWEWMSSGLECELPGRLPLTLRCRELCALLMWSQGWWADPG